MFVLDSKKSTQSPLKAPAPVATPILEIPMPNPNPTSRTRITTMDVIG